MDFWRAYRSESWSWLPVMIGTATGILWLFFIFGSSAASPAFGFLASLAPVWAGLWRVTRIVGYVITVPAAEELAFRGFLTRRLIDAQFEKVPAGTFSWFSWIVSSVLFGLMHMRLWVPGILAGLLFGLAMYRRGRLADAVLAHMCANGIIAAYALSAGNWGLLS